MQLPRLTFYHWLVMPLAIISLFVALGFLRYTSAIQTSELRHRINLITLRSDTLDTTDMPLRLKADLAFARSAARARELPRDEMSLLAAFGERGRRIEPGSELQPRWLREVFWFFQRIAGIKPVEAVYADDDIDLLSLAYNLERRRLFSEALLTFRRAAVADQGNDAQDFVHLHIGYCQFFLEDRNGARVEWMKVLNSGLARNKPLARSLLALLDSVSVRRGSVRGAKHRAEALYRAMAFRESLEVLLSVAEGERDQAYFFLRGRVNELPGHFSEAASDYRRTIDLNPRNDLALVAERRLFLMGAYYRRDQRLAGIASGLAAGLGDTEFLQFAQALLPPVSAENGQPVINEAEASALEKLLNERPAENGAGIPVKKSIRLKVRIRTRNGSVITGTELRRNAREVVVRNESGTFRIPTGDIEKREIVSGK